MKNQFIIKTAPGSDFKKSMYLMLCQIDLPRERKAFFDIVKGGLIRSNHSDLAPASIDILQRVILPSIEIFNCATSIPIKSVPPAVPICPIMNIVHLLQTSFKQISFNINSHIFLLVSNQTCVAKRVQLACSIPIANKAPKALRVEV